MFSFELVQEVSQASKQTTFANSSGSLTDVGEFTCVRTIV